MPALSDEQLRVTADVCVVGAGAAGLWAAQVAAAAGCRVVLLEKTRRTGTKVLASGGTKCNLTTTLGWQDAAALFGTRGERFLRRAFRTLPPDAVRDRFEEWGVRTEVAPLEKIFPSSGKAVHVRDALERAVDHAGVRTITEAPVADLERTSDGWRVMTMGGGEVRASRVVLSPGGMSYPSTGTTGDGYPWLEALGCEMVEPVPALVPLTSSDTSITDLTGIALQEVVARLLDDRGKTLGARERPVLFTHHGVSGPGAMDHSVHVAREVASARREGRAPRAFRLSLDLLPNLDRDEVRALLIDAAGRPGAPRIGRVLPAELPKRLVAVISAQAGLPETDPRAGELNKSQRHALVEVLKGFSVPIDGTLGFDKAEVTAGGLALREVDPGTMAVKRHPGLYACGEILDLAGPIGGLNFQSAFATAELAGRAVAENG